MSNFDDFNPELFLSQTTEEEFSTKRILVPDGDFQATIKKVSGKKIVSEKSGETFIVVNLTWVVLDEEAKRVTNEAEPVVFDSIFVDVLPNGTIDSGKGKNIQLGKLRAALGQNKPGKKWAVSMLQGGVTHIKVANRQRRDSDDTENFIKAYGKTPEKA